LDERAFYANAFREVRGADGQYRALAKNTYSRMWSGISAFFSLPVEIKCLHEAGMAQVEEAMHAPATAFRVLPAIDVWLAQGIMAVAGWG
jgi:hypothetical protein